MVSFPLSATSRFPETSPVNPRGESNRALVPVASVLPADTSDAADPAKVETLNNPAVLRTLAFTVKVTEPLLPPMVVTVIVRVPGAPRTTVTVIDVVVVAPIDVTTSFTVPVAAGTVPPGTQFVPVSVTVTLWAATPDHE